MMLTSKKQGQVLMLAALLMPVVIMLLAMIIDGGQVFLEKRRLQNMVDAAALAGAQTQDGAVALDYAQRNGLTSQDTFQVALAEPSISVHAEREVNGLFLSVLGVVNPIVTASATAAQVTEWVSCVTYGDFVPCEGMNRQVSVGGTGEFDITPHFSKAGTNVRVTATGNSFAGFRINNNDMSAVTLFSVPLSANPLLIITRPSFPIGTIYITDIEMLQEKVRLTE